MGCNIPSHGVGNQLQIHANPNMPLSNGATSDTYNKVSDSAFEKHATLTLTQSLHAARQKQ